MSAVPGAPLDPGAALGGPAALTFDVDDASQVGVVRRAAETLAADAGLDDAARGTLALVVTEIATNLARHATGGRMLLSLAGERDEPGVEVLSLDQGPGIANVGRAMSDGFSSAGTAGEGLGAIARQAHDFDVYSRTGTGAGVGTLLLARVWSPAALARRAAPHEPRAGARALDAGVVCVPLGGETASGDSWVIVPGRDRTLVAVIDGLGHGPSAAEASSAAVRVVREHASDAPAAIVRASHEALRSTRGAAMAVAAVDVPRRTVAFAGVGNISAGLHAPGGATKSLASHNGTVGHEARKVQEFAYEWPADGMLVMHSDGVNTRWRLDAYPGLASHDPALVAAALFRDAARGRDDATILALREART